MTQMTRPLMWLLVLMGVIAAMGCSGDVGDINYVQPNYVTKQHLLGKSWYYRRTIVDVPETGRGPYGEFGPWVTLAYGDGGIIERVVFEITEDLLIGYRDYEYILGGGEAKHLAPDEAYQGTPVVAFPITSHFDIQYDYDPATGARGNTIRENTTDREWWERDYMRVEWNRPQVLNVDWFQFPVELGDTDVGVGSPEYIDPDDAANPYHARLWEDEGYIDVVANHIMMPDIYTCYYDFDFAFPLECGSGELKMRHAFMAIEGGRAEEDRTYHPLELPDSVVLTEPDPDHPGEVRSLRDPETSEVVREDLMGRFGVIKLSRLTYDEKRGLTETGRLRRAFRANIWQRSLDDAGRVIPYAKRVPRPIEYTLNYDFPQELKPVAYEIEAEVDAVFREIVSILQNKPVEQVPRMFIVHENPCSVANLHTYLSGHEEVYERVREVLHVPLSADTLANYCAATEYFSRKLAPDDRFTWVQMGDPRAAMMLYLTNIVPAAYSGVVLPLADPISGRSVGTSAHVLGWTIDAQAARMVEYIDYINEELDLFDLLRGQNLPNTFFEGSYDPAARAQRQGPLSHAAQQSPSPEGLQALKERFARQGSTFEQMMTRLEHTGHFKDRLARVAGTPIEREALIRPEDLMLASNGAWQPGQPVAPELWDNAAHHRRMRDLYEKRQDSERWMSQHFMCPVQQAELDVVYSGLAESLKNATHDEKLLFFRRMLFKGVMLHELGHALGLEHNFEGTYDALNYPRKFWEIELAHGYGTEEIERHKEVLGQSEYRSSSVMDYHGRSNGRFQGLGPYDRAALKFVYGQLFERFSDSTVPGGDHLRQFMECNDYRDLLFADADGVGEQGPAYFPSLEAMVDREHVQWDWNTETDGATVASLLTREVPYRFCDNTFVNQTPTCRWFDWGANQREVQVADEVRYKNYFIFSNFRRERLVLDLNAVTGRAYQPFGTTLQTYQYFYYYRAKYGPEWETTDAFSDYAQATARGLNLIKEVLASPAPGRYYRCEDTGGDATYYSLSYLDYDPLVDAAVAEGPEGELCDMAQQVGLGIGQSYPMFLGFSEEFFNWTFTYLGIYWDKLAAIDMLTYPVARFPRENQLEDTRSYSISLYRLYHQEVSDILLSLIEFDRKSLASGLNSFEGVVVPENKFPGAQGGVALADARVVPALARNLQVNALVYGMAFLTSPLDEALDFAKHTKVVLKGAADDFFDQAGYDPVMIAECELPEGGLTYRAVPTGSALDTTGRSDIAYNFVTRCASLTQTRADALATLQQEQETLASLPPSSNEAILQERVVREAKKDYETADFRLRETEQVLLWMRQLNRVYEHGAGF